VAVFVQITGALVLASGIPAMFEAVKPNGAVVAGYVIMRAALVVQWMRAAAGDPPRRGCAYRYAAGITVLQVAWLSLLLVPAFMLPGFLVLATLEMALPLWAERHSPTTWHPHHIAERYGLLTLIVLGESVLSATVSLDSALATGTRLQVLAPSVIGGLLTMFSMWWIYFDRPVHDLLTNFRRAFAWGYGHYLVFASAAAVGTGLAVTVDVATGEAAIGPVGAGLAVTVPVSIYLIAVWILHNRPEYRRTRWLAPAAVPVILLTSFTGLPVLFTGLVLAAIVAIKVVSPRVQSGL
jgi:low temperature requirement protein LtrA